MKQPKSVTSDPPAQSAPRQRELLRAHGLAPKRSFGQNFLTDRGVLDRLHRLVGDETRGVVEIGAGLGALTRPLLQRNRQVIAIERDRDLLPVLREEFAEHLSSGALTLLEADAKTVDYAALLDGLPAPHALVGNLPYQLTGPLLRLLPALAPLVSHVVLLVQLEVAERMVASAGSAEYGALSVFLQAAFEPRRAHVVGASAFYPRPKVASAAVVLTPLPKPVTQETATFRELVQAAFMARRKTLKNAWSNLRCCDSERIRQAAMSAEVDLSRRGETLSVAQFARVADEVSR